MRLLAVLTTLALVCPAAPAPAQALNPNTLPALGDPEAEDFSVGTEQKVGEAIMREVRRDPDYVDDPVVLEYLESIWGPLVAEARRRGNIGPEIDTRFPWEPFLVRDPSINAFALPGGYIGVHLGLIAMTANRDELASVLAHELSHITQRHIARSIAASKRISLLSLASLIVGVLAASRAHSPDAANAVITGSQAAAIQGQLNFSRDMEREADRVGFAVMSGAGFWPGGMAEMFEMLDKGSRLNDTGPSYPYLRSHPLTVERIGDARARLGSNPTPPPKPQLEHRLAAARSRVLMDIRTDALRRVQALDGDRLSTALSDKLASAYSSALASTLLRDWARADSAIGQAQALLRSAPTPDARAEHWVRMLEVESLLARGAASRAAQLLQPLENDHSRPVVLERAEVAIALGPSGGALASRTDELQTWVAVHPHDATAWVLLAQAWGRLDRPLRAVRADAEARAAIGDLNGAVERLRAGQRMARGGGSVDFIDVSVIDARLRDFEVQRRQNAKDEKDIR
jgi:predicted Zn-dependent protease